MQNTIKFNRSYLDSIDEGEKKEALLENAPPIISASEEYRKLSEMVENYFCSNLNAYALLQGSSGMGKTSAVYYAVSMLSENHPSETDNIIFIELDATIYNKESKMIMEIIEQIKQKLNCDFISTQKNPYMRMLELFKMRKVIIYIKNVEVFSDEARQVFLYTFFDTINNFSGNVMVLLATSDIFFVDKLEKRVKSRFSYTSFNFYNIAFEKVEDEDRGVSYGGLIDILKSKFDTSIKSHCVYSEIMKASLEEKCIKDLFSKYHIIGMSIEWFL